MLARRCDAALGFSERQRQWLFAIEILAGFAGLDERCRVPMVGRSDADGIEVVSRQHFAKVGILFTILGVMFIRRVIIVDAFRRGFAAVCIDLADGDELHVGLLQQLRKMIVICHLATTDYSNRDSLVGGETMRRAECGGMPW